MANITTSATAKETCNNIIHFLGGRRFLMMTGTKPLAYGTNESGNDYCTFKLTRNKTKANYLRIELTAMDLFKMTFISVRGSKYNEKLVINNLYNDMLESSFEDATGLYTRL